jgi:flagellar assembly protein FliH
MSSRAVAHAAENGVEPFVYQPAAGQPVTAGTVLPGEARIDVEARIRAAAECARQEAQAETEQRMHTEVQLELERVRGEIDVALAEFVQQRQRYFENVEEEIVSLALSIARKILHREAQIDPLLLVGLVHVALEKLDSSTRVRLRVNPARMPSWERHFREGAKGNPVPELVADPAVEPGGCLLETNVGTTTIGLETHLKEIEQGFFDLLAQRPR